MALGAALLALSAVSPKLPRRVGIDDARPISRDGERFEVGHRAALVTALLELGALPPDLVFLGLAENALDGGVFPAIPHLLGHGLEFVALDVGQFL